MPQKPNPTAKEFSALGLSFQLGYTIIIPLVALALLGKILDNYLHTSLLFFFIGIILSLMISVYGVYKTVQPFLESPRKKDFPQDKNKANEK